MKAQEIKADALIKIEKSFEQGRITQEQYDAIMATAKAKDDSWWIKHKNDFRNSGCATGTLAEETRGYRKLPAKPAVF